MQKKFPKYSLWEEGKASPTLRQLEDVAKTTHAPLGYFFLPEPPRETLPIPDYRTLDGGAPRRLSPELIDTLHLMRQRQDWLREELVNTGESPLAFVGSLDAQADIHTATAQIRKTLKLEEKWARKERTWTDALRFLRQRIEAIGILVSINGIVRDDTRRKLSVEEFRGFVLPDAYAPLIFVNGADAKAAQIFTLAHELAHVWLGEGGILDLPRLMAGNHRIEVFCNAVASELLVPEKEFVAAWSDLAGEEFREITDIMVRRFKVSSLVIARRALDLGYCSREEYNQFFDDSIEKERRRRRPEKGGGDYYRNQEMRIGRRFGLFVVRAAREGRLLYRDAYHLTGLHGRTFARFAKRLEAGE